MTTPIQSSPNCQVNYSGRPVKDADVRVLSVNSSMTTGSVTACAAVINDVNSINTFSDGGIFRDIQVDNLIVNHNLVINGDIIAPYLVKTNNLDNTYQSIARWDNNNILVDSNVLIDDVGDLFGTNATFSGAVTADSITVVNATVTNNLFANHMTGDTVTVNTVTAPIGNITTINATTVNSTDFNGLNATLTGTMDASTVNASSAMITGQMEAATVNIGGQVILAPPNPLPPSTYTIELPSTFPPTLNQILSVKAVGSGIVNVDWASLPGTYSNNIVKVITGVSPIPPYQYATIAAAIAYVNTQAPSPTNLWLIQMYPGIYNETGLVLPSYVSLQGLNEAVCIIQGTTNNQHILTLEDYTYIQDFTINGPTSTNFAGIFNNTSNFATILSNISIQNCDIGVYGINNNGVNNVYMYLSSCTLSNNVTNSILLDSTASTGTVNYYSWITSIYIANIVSMLGPAIECKGTNTVYYSMSDQSERDPSPTPPLPPAPPIPPPSGTYLSLTQGSKAFVNSLESLFFDTVFYAPNDGSSPTLNVNGANFYNCYLNFNLLNPNIQGYFSGQSPYNRTIYPIDSQWFVSQSDPRILTVGLNQGSDFQTIQSALSSITSSGPNNRFIISVSVGQYTINSTLVMKPYVDINGESPTQTILLLTDGVQGFTLSANSAVSNLTIQGTGNVSVPPALFYAGDLHISPTYVNNIYFQNVYNTFQFTNANSVYYIMAEIVNCIWYQNFPWDTNINIDVSGFCGISIQQSHLYGLGSTFNYFVYTSTLNPILPCYLNIEGGLIRPDITASTHYGTAFYLSTCFCDIRDIDMSYMNTGIIIPNSANFPILRTMGLLMHDITNCISILNPNTVGNINGIIPRSSVIINSNNVSSNFVDPDGTGLTISGQIFQGKTFTQTTDITTQITQGSTLGLAIGGAMSFVGTNVTVSAGSGYIMQGVFPNDYLYYIEFSSQSKLLPNNTLTFLYINSFGVLQTASSEPNTTINIFIGSVLTDTGNILYVQRVPHIINHLASNIDSMLTSALGPIYTSGGSQVTASASPIPPNDITRISVTQGQYYFGNLQFNPDPKISTGSFFAFYRDSVGPLGTVGNTWSYQNVVDVPIRWDNGTGTLQPITAGNFVTHVLYLVGSGIDTQYLLVYGTQQFPSLSAAQTGALALPPSFFQQNVVSVASIIVNNNGAVTQIVSIQNIQPTVAYRSGTLSSTSNHSALSNLTSDDHKQYLLVNGTRAMSGPLDMGTNNVINITYCGILDTVVGSIVVPVNGINLASQVGTTPYNFYFPLTSGTFGYVLTTDGSGVSSWTSISNIPISGDINMNGYNITNGGTFTAVTLAGTLSTVAQPNVTSVGTLTSLTMGGNINLSTNNITNGGTITATTLAGTLSTVSQPNITTLAGLTSIQGQTIATTAWQYVNGLNQQVSTTSSPTFSAITLTTGATNGYVLTSDAFGNGTWVASSGGVSSITGTANQVIVSAPTGAVTLSLPQSINTTSSPTFATVNATTLAGTLSTASQPNITTLANVTTIGTAGTVSILNKLSVGTSSPPASATTYTTSTGNNEFWINSSSSLFSNLIWAKNGVASWQNYVPSGSTTDLRWYTGTTPGGDVMILTTTGTLSTATINATTLTGTLSTASQPNITTLAGLTSIRGQTIATTAWQYVNGLNQQVSTTSTPTFSKLVLNGTNAFTPATLNIQFTPGPLNLVQQYSKLVGDLRRWGWYIAGLETGPLVGSDLKLARYDDAGNYFDDVIRFSRLTGQIDIPIGNIIFGGVPISAGNWTYVQTLNQNVSTTSSPTFANITGVTTFTPATFTVTPGAGAISGPVVNRIKYTRVGGVIQMNGNIVFTQITTPASSWTIVVSVPRSANFSSTFQAIGNGVIVNSATVNSTGNITANIGAQTITLSLITSIAVLGTYTVVFNSQYDF